MFPKNGIQCLKLEWSYANIFPNNKFYIRKCWAGLSFDLEAYILQASFKQSIKPAKRSYSTAILKHDIKFNHTFLS